MFPRFNLSSTSSKMFSSVCKLIIETKEQLLSTSLIHRIFPVPTLRILSPVPHLLHSNAPPSEAEMALISGAIATAQGGISVLSEELYLLPERGIDMSRFERRRSALVDFQASHKALLSPLRRMPPEILELIFRETVDEINYQYPTSQCNIQLPAVSQVSRRWRDIAISTPALWNNITADLSKKYSSTTSFTQLLHLRLLRSNKSHLNIFLIAIVPSDTSHLALNMVLDLSDRWETANIRTSPTIIASFQRIKGNLSALRRLELTIHRYGTSPKPLYTVFKDAPMLREVYLNTECLSIHFKFPWRQLTHYKNDQGDKGRSHNVLKSLTAAKYLGLTWRSSEPLVDNLTFEKLESLHIHFVSLSHRGFFEHLTLPNVREIKVLKHLSDPTPRLIRMIERSLSPCLLHSLTLRTDFRKPGSLTLLLRLTPALQVLDIHIPSARDLAYLVVKSDRPPLVPKLQKLHLVASTVKGLEGILRRLASSRCELYSAFVANNSSAKGKYSTLPCKLDLFSIEFLDDNIQLEERELIEMRAQEFKPGVSDELDVLKGWKGILHDLSNVESDTPKKPSMRSSPNSGNLAKLDEVLSSVANYHVKDVRHLHLSGLHIELHHFAHRTGLVFGDEKYHFCRRAREILGGWAGLLLGDVWDRRWALKGRASLVYISPDNDIRARDPLSIIYGLNNEGHE